MNIKVGGRAPIQRPGTSKLQRLASDMRRSVKTNRTIQRVKPMGK